MPNYRPFIGLEVHVELKTMSKMFCGCKNDPFHAPEPNIYTCPVCLGLPGALPVPNKKAVEWTIKLGLALGCTISNESKFDRKNYFYPDLAKGYQISQYDQPFCRNGIIKTDLGDVRIHRVHLEEDTGKLIHDTVDGKKVSLVDFNRSGVPLVEIVTGPDVVSGEHAKIFLKKLHQIVRYLDISDADMDKGSMRLEPNISVKETNSPITKTQSPITNSVLPKYKVEVKNINSFNFVKKAIEYEVDRHITILQTGKLPIQETRGWNEDKGVTFSQRAKEEANDYRYFPEPDIPPMVFTDKEIDVLKATLPLLPDQVMKRISDDYGLSEQTISVLADEPEVVVYFENALAAYQKQKKGLDTKDEAKVIANWIVNKKPDMGKTTPEDLVKTIISQTTVVAVSDDDVVSAIKKVLVAQPKAVADYKSGKTQVLMFLFGMVIKELEGKGDKGRIRELLVNEISK